MIIGVSGTFGSGKDTVAEYLIREKNFQHISLSDLIREEAQKRGMGDDRDSLRNLGNILAKEIGEDALARMAIKRKKSANLVISSIRKPKEVDYLKSLLDFLLVFVDAPIEVRFSRMNKRKRAGEASMTLFELKTKENLEMSGKSSQRLDYCKKTADKILLNTSTMEDLDKKVDELINNIEKKNER